MAHITWMIIGCVGALLLVFVFPLLGVGSGVTLFIVLMLMFACHLFMVIGHRSGNEQPGSGRGHHHG
jgi:hypothetical protein